MSFSLDVFDLDLANFDADGIIDLMEDDSKWDKPPSPAIRALLTELESTYPYLEDDPDSCPWSMWPLGEGSMVDGKCCGFSIRWSKADLMLEVMVRLCTKFGLTLYNQQTGEITKPASPHYRWQRRASKT